MKYIFYIIFLIISYFFVTVLGFFAIFLSLWYWDAEFIAIIIETHEEIERHLKTKL